MFFDPLPGGLDIYVYLITFQVLKTVQIIDHE